MKAAEFISTLAMHFPVKHESEAREMEWLKTLIQALAHYEGDVLAKAAKRIIDSRTDRRFPLPAEIRKVCAVIVEETKLGKLPLTTGETAPFWSREREQLADELLRFHRAITRSAIDGGWILALHNFVRRTGSVPEGNEIAKLQREASEFEIAYRSCLSGNFPNAAALAKLGTQMLARREELSRRLTH